MKSRVVFTTFPVFDISLPDFPYDSEIKEEIFVRMHRGHNLISAITSPNVTIVIS